MSAPVFSIPAAMPRAALVTGGGARLGRAVALGLAASGVAVAVHCRSGTGPGHEAAQNTADEIRGFGVGGCVIDADLGVEAEVGGIIARATDALGPLGVLVNNASLFERDEWHDASRESWDAHIEPNLRAPFRLMQDFARMLPPRCEGMVLNMLDERVWSLTPHFVSYTVSKSALWSLTRSMALALAPRRIRVNAIGPGPAMPSPRQDAAQFAAQSASVPLGHGTSPEEIARAVMALLCLPSVTGQMLALDGGQHLQWHPAPAGDAAASPE